VVFVLLDTLRADALAAWGAEDPPMPQLDAFLARGWRFTDVWANASWTRPSIATFFTGMLPEEHGARNAGDALGERWVTLAERLKASGYATTAFVTNRAAVGRAAGFAQGFDHWWELPGDPYARAEAVGRRVRQWLDAGGAAGPEPDLLYLHYLDPHTPYLAGDAPERKTAAAYRAGYRRALEYLDGELATLLAELAERLPGDTVFLVASDHGEQFFEHELFGHGHSLYQEVVHVPAGLRWKGAPAGGDLPQKLDSRDLHDLLVAVAGGEVGHAGVPAWAARRARAQRYASVYYGTTGRLLLRPYQRRVFMRAVEQGSEKLVWSAYGDTWELYDLASDPGEQDNLAARLPARAQALAAGLDAAVAFWSPAQPLELDADMREQLRALGYLD
jgi:arylsulfatase A-like enzyme